MQRYANVDGELVPVDEIADASMGEAQTLADFVAWGLENYPAENMGLVFWNHGGGISGEWASLDGMPLAIELVYRNDTTSIYTCPILLNGEYTNLRILYDWNRESRKVLGTWGGIDYQTGASARETVPIKNDDVIKPLYRVLTDNGEDYIENDLEYTVNGEIKIEFEPLGNGDFSYSMILYDVFGNYYFTNTAAVSVDENGDVVFDMDSI